ncbi:S-transferase GstB [Seminavis robusta]|uniref:S-transferase GstB n=1 Tax=Seminavis robusta TaxID=568900 RepID=A0A9N8E982_9STRA|nr:S-transferase GstB [Seminavis robusta]|eukprot:Sro633_g178770.1 S-transferase GstB (256) ;mRNA; f:14590-15489
MWRHFIISLIGCISVANAFSSTRARLLPLTQPSNAARSCASKSSTALLVGLTLYGSQGSRSPLVNWAAYELGLDFTMGDLAKNPHPFGQIPCLVDTDKDATVFESGAILLYMTTLASKDDKKSQAEVYSWVCWANASLDPICFLETPDGKVYDTGLKNSNNKRIRQLDQILDQRQYLVSEDKFSVADVAVASYLLYVIQFFPDIDLSPWPGIVRYLKDCVSREAYAKAFGPPVQAFLVEKLENMGNKDKKLFGMF